MTDKSRKSGSNEKLSKIRASFARQAREFQSYAETLSKQDFMDSSMEWIDPASADSVLDVACGTSVMGRALAERSSIVTNLDITEAMLAEGKALAEAEGIENMVWVLGNAEEMPFLDESFEITVTRLSFHHFTQPEKLFQEMHRVLKKDGRLVIIDMVAPEEKTRAVRDQLEILRDESHVRNMSREELAALFEGNEMELTAEETTDVLVSLSAWLGLTETLGEHAKLIREALEAELQGGEKTGFRPRIQEGEIWLNQKWLFLMGRKKQA